MNSLLTKEHKWIIVPIESKVRELHSKVLLACVAAEKDYGTIIGHGRIIKKKWLKFPRGIYFDKSVARVNAKRFRLHKKHGNYVVAWCEEGLLLISKKNYQNRRISHKTFNHVDLFFAWGQYQADVVLEKAPEVQKKLVVAGNPRIDLLRKNFRKIFKQDADEINKKYGDYILINTNFSPYNNVRGAEAGLALRKKSGKISTHEHEVFWRKFIKFKEIMFYEFDKMVKALSQRVNNINIVVRPHPAENHAAWRDSMRSCDNVHIVHEGSVIPWIMAAKVSIHNGCTTGLEAYLLDRPVISYQPPAPTVYNSYLPDVISEQAYDIEQLTILTLKACRAQERSTDITKSRNHEIIHKFIHNMDGQLASDSIIRSLTRLPVQKQKFRANIMQQVMRYLLYMQPAIKTKLRHIRDQLITSEKYFSKSSDNKNLYQMQEAIFRQVFPATDLEEVNQIISTFRETSGRFEGVSAIEIEKNCFAIGRW